MNMDGDYAEQLLMDFAERTKVQLVGDSQIPLYHQLARVLQKFIQNDFLQAGDRFPSEEAVGACFNVSRPTVNKAIQELLADGWLNRVRGRGTFVNKDPHVQLSLLNDKLSLVEQFPLHKFKYRLIRRRIESPIPRINQVLGLKPDEPLLYLRRLRLMDDQPLLGEPRAGVVLPEQFDALMERHEHRESAQLEKVRTGAHQGHTQSRIIDRINAGAGEAEVALVRMLPQVLPVPM
jgi:DNA-binding GntR family transcriptional regulator